MQMPITGRWAGRARSTPDPQRLSMHSETGPERAGFFSVLRKPGAELSGLQRANTCSVLPRQRPEPRNHFFAAAHVAFKRLAQRATVFSHARGVRVAQGAKRQSPLARRKAL